MFERFNAAASEFEIREEMQRRDAYYYASQPIIAKMVDLQSLYTSVTMTFSPAKEHLGTRRVWVDAEARALYFEYEKALGLLRLSIWRKYPDA